MSALTDAMKVDLAGVFAYDIQRTAIIIENGITTTYTVLLDDSQEDEQDEQEKKHQQQQHVEQVNH